MVDTTSKEGRWSVLIRGRMAESRFRTRSRDVREQAGRRGETAAAWAKVSVHGERVSPTASAARGSAARSATGREAVLPSQEVVFQVSGQQIQTQPGETLLDAALRCGLDLPFSCTLGGCGECKQRLVSGEIVLEEPHCLTREELDQGWRLMCVGRAASRLEIEA